MMLATSMALADDAADVGRETQDQGELPFAVAESIANAFYACAERRKKPRSIHIIDRFGNTVYAGRMDGQIADNVDVALLKASAALYFRANTRPWVERAEEDPLQAMWIAQLGQFMSPVGLPVVIDGRLMGAVGIGGASGDCAGEALSEVLGQTISVEPES